MSSNLTNIGDTKDEFYRYKMPKLQTKIEGRGNGIKTVIVNMDLVAKALNRDVAYPTKFFGNELGSMSKYDKKLNKAIVNGSHDQEVLQKLLSAFIKKFVSCGKCGNPETTYRIDKKQQIHMDCKACGNDTLIDPREKLCTFIINNPPATKSSSGKENSNGTTAERPKEAKLNQIEDIDALSDNLNSRLTSHLEDSDNESEEHKSDNSNEDGDEGPSPLAIFQDYLKLKADAPDAQILAVANKIAKDFSLKDSEVICLLFQGLFDSNISKQLSKRLPLIKEFVKDTKGQKVLVGQVELLCSQEEAALKAAPQVLKFFYDEDLLDEEVILEWYEKKKSRLVGKEDLSKVKAAAKVFIDWLKSAEEESGDEDDD